MIARRGRRGRSAGIGSARDMPPASPQHGECRGGECRDLPEPVDRSMDEPVGKGDEACRGECRPCRIDPAAPESGGHREGEEPDEEAVPTSPVWDRSLNSMLCGYSGSSRPFRSRA